MKNNTRSSSCSTTVVPYYTLQPVPLTGPSVVHISCVAIHTPLSSTRRETCPGLLALSPNLSSRSDDLCARPTAVRAHVVHQAGHIRSRLSTRVGSSHHAHYSARDRFACNHYIFCCCRELPFMVHILIFLRVGVVVLNPAEPWQNALVRPTICSQFGENGYGACIPRRGRGCRLLR